MCAISGIFTCSEGPVKWDIYPAVQEMIKIMAHRGPDDQGVCGISVDEKRSNGESGRVRLDPEEESADAIGYLGFNRLSIRDLSVNGHQPMLAKSGDVVIVFNGEVYNTDALKERYLKDVDLKSRSDTEVILALYIKYGIDATVRSLDGMFAFCIVDARTGRSYLARDRVGIKPLYIYRHNGLIVFASEIKGILASGMVRPEIDKVSFYEMMMFGFNYKRTLIKGISEFGAGTYASIDLNDLSDFKTVRYWSPEQVAMSRRYGSYDECKDRLRAALERAVNLQMVSDVFVGCQLSGGVDSSLITYLFSDNKKNVKNKDKIKNISFGIIPENEDQSEEKYMDKVSAMTGIEVDKIKLKNRWVYEQWKNAIWYLDGIPSFVNEMGINALAEEARNAGVTVLMSGEGADEVLGGYAHITDGQKVLNRYKWIKRLRLDITGFLKKHYLYDSRYDSGVDERYYLLYSADGNFNDHVREVCPGSEAYIEEASKNRRDAIERILLRKDIDLFTKSRCYDLTVRIIGLCNRQDKMTMAASIENRVPFLSNDVIDVGLNIPRKYLCKQQSKPRPRHGKDPFMLQGKYLLKDICRGIYGKDFAFRYKKGFPLPLEDFIVELIDSDEFDSFLIKLEKRELIDLDVVKTYCDRVKSGSSYYSAEARMLWRLFSFEFFCEQFIDNYM